MESNSNLTFPTETISLPSKGLFYPKDHPLRGGKVEMKYMTASEEDILSNENFIQSGVVLDKLIESLTMKKFDISDVLPGDKSAMLVAARILGYGKNYKFRIRNTDVTVDLSQMKDLEMDESIITPDGTIKYTLPETGVIIEFKHLTERGYDKIAEEIEGYKKINKDNVPSVTTKLKHHIVSIDGNKDPNFIRNYVNNTLLAMDSRSLRNRIESTKPDIDLNMKVDINGVEEDVNIPIDLTFFWPDLK